MSEAQRIEAEPPAEADGLDEDFGQEPQAAPAGAEQQQPQAEPAESVQQPAAEPEPEPVEPALKAQPAEPESQNVTARDIPNVEEIARQFEPEVRDIAEQLLEQPQAALATLAARVTVRTLSAAAAALENVLPQLVETAMAQREARRSFEERLFGRYPHLRGREAQVRLLVEQARQLMPGAGMDELVEKVGSMAEILFGQPQPRPAARAPSVGRQPREEEQNPFADPRLWED